MSHLSEVFVLHAPSFPEMWAEIPTSVFCIRQTAVTLFKERLKTWLVQNSRVR